MGVMPDPSPYGSQTVTGPGWPNVDEEALAAAAASFEALAVHLSGAVVPQQQGQLMTLSDSWEGAGATAAVGEASTIISGHESNAAHAASIAAKLRAMEATVVKTKALVNATAEETQRECEALAAAPLENTQELIQARIEMGLAQNTAYVTANTTELADTLGVAPNLPQTPTTAGAPPGQRVPGQDPQQAMQMLSQMGSMAAQLPQQLGQLLGQGTQQLTQPLQQLAQPLQQMTSLFGQFGKPSSTGAAMSAAPWSTMSNHPLAGGSGAGSGAGMVRAASLPGSGGTPVRTPLLAKLVGDRAAATAGPEGAVAGGGGAGVAPVAAGGAGMGGMGMMGARGTSGGSTSGLSVPSPLEHDLAEDDVDDDW